MLRGSIHLLWTLGSNHPASEIFSTSACGVEKLLRSFCARGPGFSIICTMLKYCESRIPCKETNYYAFFNATAIRCIVVFVSVRTRVGRSRGRDTRPWLHLRFSLPDKLVLYTTQRPSNGCSSRHYKQFAWQRERQKRPRDYSVLTGTTPHVRTEIKTTIQRISLALNNWFIPCRDSVMELQV